MRFSEALGRGKKQPLKPGKENGGWAEEVMQSIRSFFWIQPTLVQILAPHIVPEQ